MKKVLVLLFVILFGIQNSYSQSTYTFESLSSSNPDVTYIVTMTYDANNNVTINRTTRASLPSDKTLVYVDLGSSDYSTSNNGNSTCVDVNVQSETGFVYFIDEDVISGIPSGGQSVCVDCDCVKVQEGYASGSCEPAIVVSSGGIGKSGVTINIYCTEVSHCDICKVANIHKGSAGNGDDHNGGAIIFKANSAN